MSSVSSDGATTTLLAAESLTRTFGSFTAVSDVSFNVRPGEVVGLLGANGAGKTTVIRMLLGLLAPTSGRALMLGVSPDLSVRSRLGYVPQNMGLYPDLTVTQNLQFSAGAYDVPVGEVPPALAEQSNRLVGELSLGLQRQLAFAVALQHSPEALVLDEPTSGVGPLSRASLWDTVRAQADDGVGVLITTHYMSEAIECDRLLLMSEGKLVAEGSEQDLIGSTTAIEVETDSWTQAFTVLSEAGEPVTLAGRGVRVANADPDHIRQVLAAADVPVVLHEVPATIEEKMVALAQ